jgi:hypothetical protein
MAKTVKLNVCLPFAWEILIYGAVELRDPDTFTSEVRIGLIILPIIFVGLAAIIVWVADWAAGGRRSTAIAVLNRRLASGEIDWAEYEEKRKLIGRW